MMELLMIQGCPNPCPVLEGHCPACLGAPDSNALKQGNIEDTQDSSLQGLDMETHHSQTNTPR